jgi:hypothetical protein
MNSPASTQPATTAVSVVGSGSVGDAALLLTTRSGERAYTAVVSAPVDSVFQALAVVYPELGIAVETIDQQARMLGNVRFERTARLGRMPLSSVVRCGTTGLGTATADSYRVTLGVLSTVRSRNGETLVETTVDGFAKQNGLNTAIACTSTGALERAIARAVQLRTAGVR